MASEQGTFYSKIAFVGDESSLNKLEKEMNGRFERVGNRFSQSLLRNIKRMAIGTLLTAAFGAITTDIEKLNQKIDDTLDKFDDVLTKARGLEGITPEQYFRASRLFQAAGVDNFDALYKSYVREQQRANLGAPSVLSNYAGEQANIENFLRVITAITQKGAEQSRAQIEALFGKGAYENVRALTQANLPELSQRIYGKNNLPEGFFEKMQSTITQARILEVQNEMASLRRGIGAVTPSVVAKRYEFQNKSDKLEYGQLAMYDNVAAIKLQLEEIKGEVQDISNNLIGKGIKKITDYFSPEAREERKLKAEREERRQKRLSELQVEIKRYDEHAKNRDFYPETRIEAAEMRNRYQQEYDRVLGMPDYME